MRGDAGVHIVIFASTLFGCARPLPARAASMLGSGIVGEDTFAIANGFADRLVGQIAFGPDTADEALRHFAAVDVEIVHQLRFLAELLHDLSSIQDRRCRWRG